MMSIQANLYLQYKSPVFNHKIKCLRTETDSNALSTKNKGQTHAEVM